jgi:hypothetical protein
MPALHTAKPATARDTRKPASNTDHRFPGKIYEQNNQTLLDIQARRLTRRFAISLPIALVVAALHHGEAHR